MTTQHTQGEWKYDGELIIADMYPNEPFNLSGRKVVAIVEQLPNWEGNARLIAAAPKLLEALENMLLDMEYARKTYPQIVISLGEDGAKALKQSRAAIAAAKGE